jgi:HSP20 family protein
MTYQVTRYPVHRTNTLFNDFDNLLHSVWGKSAAPRNELPSVDIVEEQERYLIEVDLPGYSEKEVDISVENGVLSISSAETGEEKSTDETGHDQKKKEASESRNYVLRERKTRRFSRSFVLPTDASVESIEGSMKNGVLTVTIPKREEAKPRNIEVQSN